MSGRTAFRRLAIAVVAYISVVTITIATSASLEHAPVGYVLSWCGKLLGAAFEGGPVAVSISAVAATLAIGCARGMWAAARIARATRHALAPALNEVRPPDLSVAAMAAEMGLSGHVDVSDSTCVFSFCYGLLRPRVCVSSELLATLEPNEILAVLAHERHHLTSRDPLKSLVADVLVEVAWVLPWAEFLRRAYRSGREIDADRAAISATGRLPLVVALRKMLSHPRVLTINEAVGALDERHTRLAHLLDPTYKPQLRMDRSAFVTAVIAVALITSPILLRPIDDGRAMNRASGPPCDVSNSMESMPLTPPGDCSIALSRCCYRAVTERRTNFMRPA